MECQALESMNKSNSTRGILCFAPFFACCSLFPAQVLHILFHLKIKISKVFLWSELQLLDVIAPFSQFQVVRERPSAAVCAFERGRKTKWWPGCLSVRVHGLRLHVLCGSHQPVMQERPEQDEKCLQCTRRQEQVTLNVHIQAESLMLSWYACYGEKKISFHHIHVSPRHQAHSQSRNQPPLHLSVLWPVSQLCWLRIMAGWKLINESR